VIFAVVAALALGTAEAALDSRPAPLADKLTRVRERVIHLEQELISGLKNQHESKDILRKIRVLLTLQDRERSLGLQRMGDLEKTIGALESRRGVLRERILVHKHALRRSLVEIDRSLKTQPDSARLPEQETLEAPKRKVLANRVALEIRELEALKADLSDADQLEDRIDDERQTLTYLLQDMKEKESVLELNRQLQVDLLKQRNAVRVEQLENYRKLKSTEAQVERLIQDFNARVELERTVEVEKSMLRGAFAKMKGRLQMPLFGEVVAGYGRFLDSGTGLHIFKKGIDIAGGKKMPVHAVSGGRIAYSGQLASYGRVTIIDHGDHFYSLCANLGELRRKVGDNVATGDAIGTTDESGTPVYFEIRSRNVAVNPLQWLSK